MYVGDLKASTREKRKCLCLTAVHYIHYDTLHLTIGFSLPMLEEIFQRRILCVYRKKKYKEQEKIENGVGCPLSAYFK